MPELFNTLRDILYLVSVIRLLPAMMRQFQQSALRWEMENSVADLKLKARGHVLPVLIERLDDGTDPTRQHLACDMAPKFPQERIDRALYYRETQSIHNIFIVLGTEVAKQAQRGAEPGDERAGTVVIDILGDAVRYTFEFRIHVGQDFKVVSEQKDASFRRLFAQMPERVRMLRTLNQADKDRTAISKSS